MIRLIVFIFILVLGVAFGLSLEGKDGLLIVAYQGKSYDIAMVDVGLGSTQSIGDVEIRGLNLTGTLINVVGHP